MKAARSRSNKLLRQYSIICVKCARHVRRRASIINVNGGVVILAHAHPIYEADDSFLSAEVLKAERRRKHVHVERGACLLWL